jgi:hypothetical protein
MTIKCLLLLMAVIPLTGCLEEIGVAASGEPFSPTFKFKEKVVLVDLSVRRYCLDRNGDVRFHTKWTIEAAAAPKLFTEVRYGEIPNGYSQLDAPSALKVNQIYSVEVPGLGTSSVGVFLLQKTNKGVVITNIERSGLKRFLDESRGLYDVSC